MSDAPERLRIHATEREIRLLSFSADARRLAVLGDDGVVTMWDVQKGQETAAVVTRIVNGESQAAFERRAVRTFVESLASPETGRTRPGLLVQVTDHVSAVADATCEISRETVAASAQTSATGLCFFPNLPPGTYRLRVQAKSFIDAAVEIDVTKDTLVRRHVAIRDRTTTPL